MKSITQNVEETILSLIQSHKGKDNPIQVKELINAVSLSDREIRKVVQYLINERGHPIGSTTRKPYGFFLIISTEDYLEAIKNLVGRKEEIKKRIEALQKACKKGGIEVPDVKINKSSKHMIFNISNSIVINLK